MDEKIKKAALIAKALAYTENGGKPRMDKLRAGKTGEMKSLFQFTPATWKNYAKQATGDENLPLTPDNEFGVATTMAHKWLQEGKTVPQIASMWNAGTGEPDAHTGRFSTGRPSVGINKKYGVKYDVPGYAKKVQSHYDEFTKTDEPITPNVHTPWDKMSPQANAGPMPNSIGSLIQLATKNTTG